jgi:outer membrane biosynthesis protein TonB
MVVVQAAPAAPTAKAVVAEQPKPPPTETRATAQPAPKAAEKPAEVRPVAATPRPTAPAAATNAPVARPALEQAGGGGSKVLTYALGGVGVALLGGGAFVQVQAARADNELTAGAHTQADADALIDTSKSKHLLGAVLLGAGLAAAAGAVVGWVLAGD